MKLRKLLVLLLLLGAAFVLSACGEQGAQGETGDTGLKGETGAQGDKGPTGPAGEAGAKGESGANGVGIQFSYGSEGILWRYIGASEWNVGVTFEDLFKLLETDEKILFDYYVDPSLALSAGDPLIAYGNELEFGKTAFSSVGSALAAIKTAAGESGYEGATLFLEKGTYKEAITIDVNDLTILGPNVNKFAGGEITRKDEAEITTKITVADGVKGLKINGLKFSAAGQVAISNASDVALLYSLIDGTTGDGIVDVTGLVTNLHVCYNYSENYKGYRFIHLNKADGLNVSCNVIKAEAAGAKYDFINASGVVKGKFRVLGNTFEHSLQSFLYIKYVGVIDAEIAGNTVVGIANTAIDFRDMTENGDNKFDIHNNVFEEAGLDWRPIRIRTAGYDENDTITVNIYDNAFIDTYTVVDEVKTFANNPSANGGSFDKVYTVGRNFYQISGEVLTEVTDANFAGHSVGEIGAPYAKEEDIPEYVLPNDIIPLSKEDQLLADLAAEFVADFKATTARDIQTIDRLDTDYLESVEMATFLGNAAMLSKWEWLLVGLSELSEDNSHDPTIEGFDAESNKGFFLANINGFFTRTEHKDTHLGTQGMDFSDPTNVKKVLSGFAGE